MVVGEVGCFDPFEDVGGGLGGDVGCGIRRSFYRAFTLVKGSWASV